MSNEDAGEGNKRLRGRIMMGKMTIRCPYCGSEKKAGILWGMPAWFEDLENDLNAGKVIIGGCMSNAAVHGFPGIEILPSCDLLHIRILARQSPYLLSKIGALLTV